jgi:carboxypeptidase C (cathepsin A)
MVGEDAYYFFQAFFKSHPEYAKSPLYIIGESYGGYVKKKRLMNLTNN